MSETTVRLSEAIEAYLVEKYGDPPTVPPPSDDVDGWLDIWLAIHGTMAK